MKCQNCGKSEVNFRYSSNVNGCVTEANLCSECASKSGYDFGSMFNVGGVLDGFFPMSGLPREFFAIPMPMTGFGAAFPVAVRPLIDTQTQHGDCNCGCERSAPDAPTAEVDDEMRKRREVNVLREQMRLAAENDDFEKAIEIREKIKEMEV